jgi:DNA-binding NarL/FixJ family response regulator
MNVIIADDHPIVLFGIRKSLEQIEWVNVVGEFEDSTALINNLPKLDAHVLITDLSMPGDKYGDGITLDQIHQTPFPGSVYHCSDDEQQPGDPERGAGSGYRRDRAETRRADRSA